MAKALTKKNSSKKAPSASETSDSIAEQTAKFLKAGNKIEVVASGISGQPLLGPGKPTSIRGGR